MKQKDDKWLVRAFILTRNEFVFRRLYRSYSPYLFRFAWRLVGNDTVMAEDAVQETWIRAVEGIETFKGRSSFKTWISGILVNCCREHRRESGREVAAHALPEHAYPAANSIEDKLDVQYALSKLPAGYREVLLLHDYEGFTHEEIADVLGIAPGTSKSQLFNARNSMRDILK